MTDPEPQDADRRACEWSPQSFQPNPSSPYYVPPPSTRHLRLWRVFLVVTPIPAIVVVTVICLVQHYWWFAVFYAFMLLTFVLLRRAQLSSIRAELRRREGEPGRRTES